MTSHGQTVARRCRHVLQRDDASEVEFEDSNAAFAALPPLSHQGQVRASEGTRILIYQELPSLGRLPRNVLSSYGVDSLSIDGNMSFEDRNGVVYCFQEPNPPRVFVFWSVGSAGLNHVMIFLDQLWSAQDERQIRGRARRQPQSPAR